MKKLFLLLNCLWFALGLNAQDIQDYKVEVGQFNKLRVTDNVHVVYRCLPDSSGFVQYRGKKEFADAFILTPKDGQLRVQVSTEDVGNPELPVLYVYSDFLNYVENSSDFTLTVENPAPCAEFKAVQIGNGTTTVENIKATKVEGTLATGKGTVTLSGECREGVFKMVGTGLISADRLKSNKVLCKILGSGSMGVWATETLNVKGIGSTKIYYKGEPIVKKVGGGKLYELPEGDSPAGVGVDEISVEEVYPEEKRVEDE